MTDFLTWMLLDDDDNPDGEMKRKRDEYGFDDFDDCDDFGDDDE